MSPDTSTICEMHTGPIQKYILDFINDLKSFNRTNKKTIAKSMNITAEHLSNLLHGHNEWSASKIEDLSKALKMPLSMLFPWNENRAHALLHRKLQLILENAEDQALCVETMIENAYEAVIHSARDEPKKETKHRRKAGIA